VLKKLTERLEKPEDLQRQYKERFKHQCSSGDSVSYKEREEKEQSLQQ
jgi:hypothetical protein